MDKRATSRPIDPILTLPVQSPATSICFVSRKTSSIPPAFEGVPKKLHPENLDRNVEFPNSSSPNSEQYYAQDSEEDDDDEDDEVQFRSSTICVKGPENSRRLLSDRFLASSHSNGEALIWDLQNQKQVATISPPRGGSGICVRRTHDPSQIIFQTRDPQGTVSLHSLERCNGSGGDDSGTSSSISTEQRTKSTIIRQYETYSKTFCQASPCHGNQHLIALPSTDPSVVTVADGRAGESVANFCIEKHGMVTSLALSVTDNVVGHGNGRPILACGMESGTTLFFDISSGSTKSESSFSIGKDPILSLDLFPSCDIDSPDVSLPKRSSDALLVAAGMAGDAQDVSELSEDEAGRAVIFKAHHDRDDDGNNLSWKFRQRARLSTCRVDRESYSGKPGISVCRFRPNDGRLLAIGGWDKRIRLFERSKGKMVAILKGSTGSISDLDWAPDSVTSGLLASTDKDDKLITLWRCFGR